MIHTKLLTILSSITLAMAGAVALSGLNTNNTEKVESASAADNTTIDIYFSMNWGGKYDLYFHGWGGGNDSWILMNTEIYKNEFGQSVYKATVETRHTNYQFQYKDNEGDNGSQRIIYTSSYSNFTNNIGYNFKDWNNGTPTLNTWTAQPYTIAFNSNGGSGSMSSLNAYNNAQNGWGITSGNIFTKANCDFTGWNTKADGSGTSFADKATIPNGTCTGGTLTLYAQWVNKRQVVVGGKTYETTEKQDTNPWEYVAMGVPFKTGDSVQGAYHKGTPYSLDIENGGASSCFSDKKSKIDAEFDVYLKSYDSGSNYNKVYIGFTDATRGFRTTFMTTFQNAICKADGSTNFSDLKTAWDNLFKDNAIPYYYATDKDSNADFNALYDVIATKYVSLTDYLGRVPTRGTPVRSILNFGQTASDSTMLIAIVSLVGLTAIGGYFFVKKRKENY